MHIFVTGIGTDVGKTVASAIITEALQADYWKPIQAGDLQQSDSHKIQSWLSNDKTVVHPNAYALQTPASPHWAAVCDGIRIETNQIQRPQTNNTLLIEGAGGLLVPLNEEQLIVDLIEPNDRIVVVSRHYLGSINHTLLTLECLQARGLQAAGIIFNGEPLPATETAILNRFPIPVLGRLLPEPYINARVVSEYAESWQPDLQRHLKP